MAVFVCKICGTEREGRCKPQKCECGAKGTFEKKEPVAQTEEKK